MAPLSVLLTTFYLTYLIVATPLQLFLLYFIIFHSSKSLQTFRFLPAYTAISQLTHAYGSWFTQITFALSDNSYQVRSYGLCRYCQVKACFVFYELCQMASLTATISIVLAFDFKYLSVSRLFVTRTRLSKSFAVCHTPVLLFLMLQVWVYFDLYRNPETSSSLFTNADGDEYSIIAEFSKVSIPMLLTVLVMYFVAFFPVPFCWHRRRSIIRKLEKTKERISEAKRADHEKFVMGLLFQAMIPTVVLPLSSLVYFLFTLNHTDDRMQQLNVVTVGLFSSVLDPLITLYTVGPFRNKLKSWVFTSKTKVHSLASVS